MKIGYRRVAGKVGLTNQENGIRGAWVDKRLALFRAFQKYGHTVSVLSPLTDLTAAKGLIGHAEYKPCDILLLEFGGTNLQFYGDFWDATVRMIKQHRGEIIFINDDPDLPFVWHLLPNEDWRRWTVAANAAHPKAVREILKCPAGVRVIDYPMHTGMKPGTYAANHNGQVVYIGRPNGRKKHFTEYAKADNLVIAGKPDEWTEYPFSVYPTPQQKDRRRFYKQYAGCLAVYDDKHKMTGWRTGRAYHALYAGVPVCAPTGNEGLSWTFPANTAQSEDAFANMSAEQRQVLWHAQIAAVVHEPPDITQL